MSTFKQIYVFEGPAASGKSSLIRHLEAQTGLVEITRPPVTGFSRTDVMMNDQTAAPLSLIKDTLALIGIVVTDQKWLMVDRLVVSQIVYGGLRRDEVTINPTVVSDSLRTMDSHARLLQRELALRSRSRIEDERGWTFVFLDPTAEMLNKNRVPAMKHGRVFFSEMERELSLYKQTAQIIADLGYPVIIYEVDSYKAYPLIYSDMEAQVAADQQRISG